MIRTGLLACAAVFLLHAADLDNEFVHVIRAEVQPHNRTALHRHEFNRVIVALDAGELQTIYQDGRTETQRFTPGMAVWAPAGGMHTSENVGARPVRVVEVEIKKPAPAAAAARNPALDPVALDPQHNVLLFDNPQVRVFRSWRGPGASEKMHEHAGAGRVAVLLTDLDARTRLSTGATAADRASAGDVLWSGPVSHAATNTGAKRFEMIVIEIK